METNSIPIQELLDKAPSHTVNELANFYQTDYGTIYYILRKYNVEAMSETISKEVLEAIFEEPTTIEGAAEQLHCTAGAITSAIKRFGLFGGRKPSTKGKFNGTRAFKVLGYILNHPEENLASVGRRFNCTREYVRQIKEAATTEGIIKQEQEGIEL